MPVAAERPLIGNDEEIETERLAANVAERDQADEPEMRPDPSEISFGFKFGPPANDVDRDELDGPIIKRVDPPCPPRRSRHGERAISTPRFFSQQFDDDDFPPPDEHDAHTPAMQSNLLGDADRSSSHDNRRFDHDSFSVAAVRAKRMNNPSRRYRATGLITKSLAVAAIGALCIVSGVTVGLYGSELGYQVERRAQMASASLSGIWPWGEPASETSGESLTPPPPATANEASPGGPPSQADNAPLPGAGATASPPAGGKKLIYDRILPSGDTQTTSNARQQVLEVKPEPSQLSGLDRHLEVPGDLILPVVNPSTAAATPAQ